MSTGLTIGSGVHVWKGIFTAAVIVAAAVAVPLLIDPGLRMEVEDAFTMKTIYIDATEFRVWVATTPQQQEQSLTNRASIGMNEGMIFVFAQDGRYGVSTAEMQFPVDILWLDDQGNVVATASDVPSGDSAVYPQDVTLQARYIMLLNAGALNQYSIGVGSTANLTGL